MSLRILLVDDHEVVRQGVRALLTKAGWNVCGEAGDGREAIALATELRPDVVIMDVGMPNLNGLEAARQILKASPRTALLVLSTQGAEALVRELVAAGCRGFVLKSDAARDLVAAVESLEKGRPFFSAAVADVVISGFLKQGVAAPVEGTAPEGRLTTREREVLQLLAEGSSNKEVASALDISVKTAEAHRANLMKKLKVRSVGELVRFAVRNGIVEP